MQQLTDADERVDRLFERCAGEFDAISVRSAELLRWRFLDRRAGRYRLLTVVEGEELRGYVVVGRWQGLATIADVLVDPGREDVLLALLWEALALARRDGVTGLTCWTTPGHPYRAALDELGFLDPGRRIPLSYRAYALPEGAVDVLASREARLHFLAGDLDVA